MKSVLIFDSGVGGLSVYQEITQLIPNQHIIYAFDNAAFPYGELNDDVLVHRVCAMIRAIQEQYEISLVVIACNTASTLVLPPLRHLLDIPVVGVVPAIKPAATASKTKHIALLATPATVRRQYTHQLIKDFANTCQVDLIGSTELVYLAESKLRGIPITAPQLAPLLAQIDIKVDHLVLGCTHFPLLKAELAEVLHSSCHIIDSGMAIATRVAHLLAAESNVDRGDKEGETKRLHQVLSSAPVNGEIALNRELLKMGFEKIIRTPIF